MTAAWELTRDGNGQNPYEVHVYQMGWRLGGKGASGRNLRVASRIEEHGIHFWMGFYENAFHLIRQVYGECRERALTPHSPFQDWQDAFLRQDIATNMDPIAGSWKPWPIHFPSNDALPGEPALFDAKVHAHSPWDLEVRLVAWVFREFEAVRDRLHLGHFQPPDWMREVLGALSVEIGTHLDVLHRLVRALPLEPALHTGVQRGALAHLLECTRDDVLGPLEARLEQDDAVRHFFYLADAGLAMARGMIADDIITRGFSAIDSYDLMQWLSAHGCRNPRNPFVLAGYDALFAYERGDPDRPNIAAGGAVLGLLRMMLTYRGSIFWRMRAGMGDAIFAPLYLALKARGVRFHFFHRVSRLGLNEERTLIEAVDLRVQATPKDPAAGYDPLVTVRDLPCWPSEPLYDQLVEGERLHDVNLESDYAEWPGVGDKTLRRGEDFDDVVLALSLGPLREVAPELIAARQDWQTMVDQMATVQTQAMQLWLRRDAVDLGYPAQPPDQPPCVTAFVEPHDTWADMTHLLAREEWTAEDGVRLIAYFCNAFPDDASIPPPFTDPGFPARQLARVRAAALTFLETQVKWLWPRLGEGFDWDALVDRSGATGPQRLDAQYLRANIDRSERYVLSVKGSSACRLHPGRPGFDNLYLAGDWTYNVLNAGCVEAAVISGRLASRAICGRPTFIYGAFGEEEP